MGKKRIAIVGCGISGLTAGHLLNKEHDVYLYEKNDYIGGHTRTLHIDEEKGVSVPVDTGFIVMNHRNYPLFSQLLEDLDVELDDSSMTFSFEDREKKYAYSGNSLRTLFPKLAYLWSRPHLRFLKDLYRFSRIGYRDLCSGKLEGLLLKDYCASREFSTSFLENYLYPMGAAKWSSPKHIMGEFPAKPYLHFLENHGLLRLHNRPQWRYVKGGSSTYVEALVSRLANPPQTSADIVAIGREETGPQLKFASGRIESFDAVVIATHPDQALELLSDPSDEEKHLLGQWEYQPNEVVLHTDAQCMPANKRLWSSWNFRESTSEKDNLPVAVSYYMNRLQNLPTEQNYFVTLNGSHLIDDSQIIDRTTLHHPLYSFESLRTQDAIRRINGANDTFFCGSFLGYGFHEDGVRSGVEVARALGVSYG